MNNENQTNLNPDNNSSFEATPLGAVPNSTPEVANPEPVAPEVAGPVNPEVAGPVNPPVDNPVPPVAPTAPAPENVVNPTPEVGSAPEPLNPSVNSNPTPTPTPVALDPIAQPIPGTTNTSTTNNNINSNGFVESPKVANVGTEVPNQEEKKPKKGMNKIVFILLIVALLAAIAYGVYYYLSLGQKPTSKISVNPQNLEIEANSVLSSNLADYATFSGTDPKNCSLDTSNVDVTTAGNYKYTIKCGNDSFEGNIIVINNTNLTVMTKDVYTGVATENTSNITAEKFVVADTCSGTECTYAFDEGFDINSTVKTAGTYDVPLVITDKDQNTSKINSTLVVIEDFKILFSYSKTTDNMKVTDKIAINNSNEFTGNAYRVYEFTFANVDDYEKAVGNREKTITYNNITGTGIYDDQNHVLTIKMDLTSDILNNEFGGTFPKAYAEISNYYLSKEYEFTMEQ